MSEYSDVILGILGSLLGALFTYVLTRPKVNSEVDLNEANAGAKTVEMALAFAEAADKKAKDIEHKLLDFESGFKELQVKFTSLSKDYVMLLQYNEKVKKALMEYEPNHPLLKASV